MVCEMNDETRVAIEHAKDALMRMAYGMAAGADQESIDAGAPQAQTGVSTIDELLLYAVAADPQGTIQVRWAFLDHILQAANEAPEEGASHQPAKQSLRRVKRLSRRDKAAEAAEHLQEAATLLADLDNKHLAVTLTQLAGIIRSRASTSQISAVMNTAGIVPGMYVRAACQMQHGSSDFSGARGRASRRADIIRFVSRWLSEDAPPTTIARLLSDVLNIKCRHDNVVQARGEKASPPNDVAIDLQSTFHRMVSQQKP